MRTFVAALLPLVACGCSVPQEIVVQDPVAAPAPISKPKTSAISEAKTMRFAWEVVHEISCSQSFERISKSGDFTLELTPPHGAKLTRTMIETETLGAWPEMGKKSKPPATYERARRDDVLEGTVGRIGDTLQLDLATDGAPLSMTCAQAKVKVVVYEGGKHDVDADVLRCTPSFGLPDALHEAGWGGGLLFSEKSIRAVVEKNESFGSFDVGPELHFGY